jgi:hypothetical protein
MQPDTSSHGSSGAGHELRDVEMKYVYGIMAGVGVLTIVGMLVTWLYVKAEDRARVQPQISPLAATLPQHPPEPRLQSKPAKDFAAYRAGEEEILKNYALLDEKGEVIRIPIEKALEIIAQRGLPARREEVRK